VEHELKIVGALWDGQVSGKFKFIFKYFFFLSEKFAGTLEGGIGSWELL
jgi:hypothetical protein